jgi:hypothetical protein
MRPVEIVPGIGERGKKKNGGGDEFKYHILDIW